METVVFLHPVGLDHHCWDGTGLKGAMPDCLGHGNRSLPSAASLTLEMVADDIAQNHSGDLHLVGASMGGMVAQHIAVRHPTRVKSMLLVCTGADSGGETESNPASPAALIWPAQALKQRADETLKFGMSGVLASTLERWFTPAALAAPSHPGVTYARQRLLDDDPVAFAAYWNALANSAIRSRLSDIRVPVTVLGGRQDVASPPERVGDLFNLLPNCRLEVIDGPHILSVERPRDFAGAVSRHFDWIASLGAAGDGR